MDPEDFRILVEIYRRPFASIEAIGRALGVTGTAVRGRWDRLVERGVLHGFYVIVPAPVFRRHHRIAAYFDVESEPELDELLRVEDVVNIWRGAPRMLNLNLYVAEPDRGPPEELHRLFGRAPDSYVQPDAPDRWSPATATLSPLDWRVLRALLDDPRAPLRELAERAGLTERTVRQRRDDLLHQELLQVAPILDVSHESGSILYSGYAALRSAKSLPDLGRAEVAQTWVHHHPPGITLVGHATAYGEVMELERRLRADPGVAFAHVTVARGGALAKERLARWMDAEVERFRGTTGLFRSAGSPRPRSTEARPARRR